MSRPPRSTTRPSSAPAQSRDNQQQQQQQNNSQIHHHHHHHHPSYKYNHENALESQHLISTEDGYAQLAPDGEIHVGRPCLSVVYRRRKAAAAPLGRSSPMILDGRYTTLPKNFVFGVANKKEPVPTANLLQGWKQHAPNSNANASNQKLQYDFGRDFVALNRNSLHERCITPSEVRWYRQNHDARVKPHKKDNGEGGMNGVGGVRGNSISRANSRSSTPIGGPNPTTLDPSSMRVAGISSAHTAIPELRFASKAGSSGSAAAVAEEDVTARDINSNMSSLVAHEYRYAWVASKIADHEEKVRRTERIANATPSSITRRAGSAGPQQRRAGSESSSGADGDYYYQQQQGGEQNFSAQQGGGRCASVSSADNNNFGVATGSAVSELGIVMGPSGRLVSHYPKLVSQRVRESNSRMGMDRPHPKEYYTMKQFKDIPSRFSTPSGQCF